jgi:hypothetical protein
LHEYENGTTNYPEVAINTLIRHNAIFEDRADLYERSLVIKDFFREYLRANPLNNDAGEKYGVVTHSSILSGMTATGFVNGTLVDSINFKNCEIKGYDVK